MHVAFKKSKGSWQVGARHCSREKFTLSCHLARTPFALFAALGLTSLPQAMNMTLCLRDFALQMTCRRLNRILTSIRHIKHIKEI